MIAGERFPTHSMGRKFKPELHFQTRMIRRRWDQITVRKKEKAWQRLQEVLQDSNFNFYFYLIFFFFPANSLHVTGFLSDLSYLLDNYNLYLKWNFCFGVKSQIHVNHLSPIKLTAIKHYALFLGEIFPDLYNQPNLFSDFSEIFLKYSLYFLWLSRWS